MLITVEDRWNNGGLFVHPKNEYDYIFIFNGHKIWEFGRVIATNQLYGSYSDESGNIVTVNFNNDDLVEVEFRNFHEEMTKMQIDKDAAMNLIHKYQKAKKFEYGINKDFYFRNWYVSRKRLRTKDVKINPNTSSSYNCHVYDICVYKKENVKLIIDKFYKENKIDIVDIQEHQFTINYFYDEDENDHQVIANNLIFKIQS